MADLAAHRAYDRMLLRAKLDLPAPGSVSVPPAQIKLARFNRAEVIELLGDDHGSTARMLPVDVALAKLGIPIVDVDRRGKLERLRQQYPAAWEARFRSDRQIVSHVASTYKSVPRGWYPDRERLLMSAAEAPEDDLAAAGPSAMSALAELVPTFRFDLLPDDLRLFGFQMWHRRRLAGLVSFRQEGLWFGFWDDVMSAYQIPSMPQQYFETTYLAVCTAIARDVCMMLATQIARGKKPGLTPFGEIGLTYQRILGPLLHPDKTVRNCAANQSIGNSLGQRYSAFSASKYISEVFQYDYTLNINTSSIRNCTY